MQSPLIVFSHIKKTVVTIPTGSAADKRLDEVLAWQRKQCTTSGRPTS